MLMREWWPLLNRSTSSSDACGKFNVQLATRLANSSFAGYRIMTSLFDWPWSFRFSMPIDLLTLGVFALFKFQDFRLLDHSDYTIDYKLFPEVVTSKWTSTIFIFYFVVIGAWIPFLSSLVCSALGCHYHHLLHYQYHHHNCHCFHYLFSLSILDAHLADFIFKCHATFSISHTFFNHKTLKCKLFLYDFQFHQMPFFSLWFSFFYE